MNRRILAAILLVTLPALSSPQLHAKGDDGWGWAEAIVTGAVIGTGVALAGTAVHHASQSISSSWNHSYVTAVSGSTEQLSRQYRSLMDSVLCSSDKKSLARSLSENYCSVKKLIRDFDNDVINFDNAISSLRGKIDEWRQQDSRHDIYREGKDALRNAQPLQQRLHETNDQLQSHRCYFILYDIVRHRAPELKRYETYPYHALLDDLEHAKSELISAINNLRSCFDLDCCDRELLNKAELKLDKLTDAYRHVLESAQYHHEKLEKLRAQRQRELMEAQRRLREAEEARMRAELARERELAYADWRREQSDLERLRRELRELEDLECGCVRLPYEYAEISLHIDL